MKLGSSRGMDTKRPPGSERSKPCHKLQLTRRSQPPYPWPPEQAQSGVSKPYRTTWRQFDDGVRLRERKRDNEPVLIGDCGEAARWEARRIVEGDKVPKLDVAREPPAERDGRPALRHAVFELDHELGVGVENDAVAVDVEDLSCRRRTRLKRHGGALGRGRGLNARTPAMQPDVVGRIELLDPEL